MQTNKQTNKQKKKSDISLPNQGYNWKNIEIDWWPENKMANMVNKAIITKTNKIFRYDFL